MAESPGAGSGHWEIVLVVVERGGSPALVAEPTAKPSGARSVAD